MDEAVASPTDRGRLARLPRQTAFRLAAVAFAGAVRLDGLVYRLLARRYGRCAHGGGRPDAIHFFVGSLGLGGTQRQLVALVRHLTHRGYRCKVWVQDPQGFFAADIEEAGAVWECVFLSPKDPGRGLLLGRLGRFWQYRSHVWMALSLRERLRRERPTVLQCLLDTTNVAGALAGRMAGVPVVVAGLRSLHPEARGDGTAPFQQRCYRLLHPSLVEAVVANSESGRRSFIARQPAMPPGKVHVVLNGLDPPRTQSTDDEIRSRLDVSASRPVVVWAGRLAPEKRPDCFLRACAVLAASGVRFQALVIGDGQERVAAERLASDLGLDEHVRFVGVRRDVPDMLRIAQVAVLTSEIEGLPNILIEASLCGCPVVATRTGGVAEIVEHGVTGFLVDVGDHTAIASHIARLIDDRALAQTMGRRAADRARQLFNSERMGNETLELYQRLAVRRGARLGPTGGARQ
jgi:glycosyltransferase involved in cell wall biosynthesis